MIQELTLVWLSGTSLPAHQAEIQGWSKAHQVVVHPAAAAASPVYDPAIAEAIEVQLERGRTAVAMQQADAAALQQTCQQILQHPELPQAAWLLAECHRLNALISAQSADAVAAAQRQQAAAALEGPRAPVYSAEPIPLPAIERLPVVEIECVGPRATDRIFIDGEPTGARTLTTVGTHHVRVTRDDTLLWAGWLEVAAQGGPLIVPLAVQPCSAQDLSGAAITGAGVVVPEGARCLAWVLAQPQRDGTGIDLWQCQRDRCTGPQQWPVAQRHDSKPVAGGSWYVWPLVGVGVALGTAAVLWQAGAFDGDTEQAERPFTITGPNAAAPGFSF
jgi:hypothetical protein